MLKIDQFTAANEAAINQFSYFAQLSLANVERFAELGLGAAREAVEQAAAHAQSLAGAKDVHEVIAINSAALEPVMKRAYAYSRSAYETKRSRGCSLRDFVAYVRLPPDSVLAGTRRQRGSALLAAL